MKAYIYGGVLSTSIIDSNYSSDGFSVSSLGTGIYRVTFTHPPAGHYTVVAIKSYTTLPRFVTVLQNSGYFDVYIRDLSGNLVNGGFNFVVFKK